MIRRAQQWTSRFQTRKAVPDRCGQAKQPVFRGSTATTGVAFPIDVSGAACTASTGTALGCVRPTASDSEEAPERAAIGSTDPQQAAALELGLTSTVKQWADFRNGSDVDDRAAMDASKLMRVKPRFKRQEGLSDPMGILSRVDPDVVVCGLDPLDALHR
jgi:hypothetical protein